MLLEAAGWHVCDASAANIHAARGVAIREFPLPGYGFADYLLYVDGKAAGVITCSVTYGFRSEEELRKAGPDYIIHTLSELKNLFMPEG